MPKRNDVPNNHKAMIHHIKKNVNYITMDMMTKTMTTSSRMAKNFKIVMKLILWLVGVGWNWILVDGLWMMSWKESEIVTGGIIQRRIAEFLWKCQTHKFVDQKFEAISAIDFASNLDWHFIPRKLSNFNNFFQFSL